MVYTKIESGQQDADKQYSWVIRHSKLLTFPLIMKKSWVKKLYVPTDFLKTKWINTLRPYYQVLAIFEDSLKCFGDISDIFL